MVVKVILRPYVPSEQMFGRLLNDQLPLIHRNSLSNSCSLLATALSEGGSDNKAEKKALSIFVPSLAVACAWSLTGDTR